MSTHELPLSVDIAADRLTLHWPDGPSTWLAAELRARCRCADCHTARLRGNATSSTGAAATLVGATAIGHYALQLRFADGHDRGIFPWATLRALRDMAATRAPEHPSR